MNHFTRLVVTGSIGMGKSTTARMVASQGWPLYDADQAVHKLYMKGGAAVEPIAKIFPAAISEGAIDRKKLSKIILGDERKIKQIEAIVHPMTGKMQADFVKQAEKNHAPGVVFDIPLFFETGGDKLKRADYIIVASAPYEIQKKRALARPDMTEEKFSAILARQTPDQQKRQRADFIVETGHGMAHAQEQVAQILQKIKQEQSQ